jgi:hypothetical protein
MFQKIHQIGQRKRADFCRFRLSPVLNLIYLLLPIQRMLVLMNTLLSMLIWVREEERKEKGEKERREGEGGRERERRGPPIPYLLYVTKQESSF